MREARLAQVQEAEDRKNADFGETRREAVFLSWAANECLPVICPSHLADVSVCGMSALRQTQPLSLNQAIIDGVGDDRAGEGGAETGLYFCSNGMTSR